MDLPPNGLGPRPGDAVVPSSDSSVVPEPMGPVVAAERVRILDVLRGFALVGILTVNIAGFSGATEPPAAAGWPDQAVTWFVQYLTAGKFYVLFSFLFGLGFALQLARAQNRGVDIRSLYRRRTGILFVIGLVHAALWWPGDILRLYGLLGFALLAFRHRSTRTILVWAAGLLAASTTVTLAAMATIQVTDSEPVILFGRDLLAWDVEAHHGSFADLVVYQTALLPLGTLSEIIGQGFSAMAMFLLGLAVGRSRVFEQVAQRRTLFVRLLLGGLVVGGALELWQILAPEVISETVNTVGGPVMALVYVSTLTLLFLTRLGQRLLAPLGELGRMALSNYLGQSLICSFVFSGYGLDLYQQVQPTGLLLIVFAVIAVQLVVSRWWLARFRFGPAEWAWRSFTYGARQPWRRVRGVTVGAGPGRRP